MDREARGASCSRFAIDIDFANSNPNFLAKLLPPDRCPSLLRFTKRPKEWKAATSAYYGCSAEESKKILLRRINCAPNPPSSVGRNDEAMPILSGLANECVYAVNYISEKESSISNTLRAAVAICRKTLLYHT